MNTAFMTPKVDALAEQLRRVLAAERLIASGVPRAEVREVIMKRFGLSRRTAYRTIETAINERPACPQT